MDISLYLAQQLAEVENTNNNLADRASILYNLIAVLSNEGLKRDLYLYVKKFIILYLDSIEDKTYGYDTLDKTKITSLLVLLTVDEQLGLLKYLRRNLRKRHFDDLWDQFAKTEFRLKIQGVQGSTYWYFNPWCLLKVLYYRALNSISYMIILLLVILVIQIIILLPNPGTIWPSIFSLEYMPISDNFLLNHTCNVFLKLFEVDSDFKIKPIGALGVLLLGFGTAFKLLIITKFIFDSLLKKIKIYE
ncbi:hypothetical protein [Chitinophaga sp. RAB17]|uniref:hypothetical protein n=1 Tax=Chitinophaga sp. RAB17 TaxID=3233049 RepID=UPI003F925F20